MSGNVSTCSLALASLILDRSLQCRVTVQEDVVEEYSDAMSAGAVFPAVEVVVVMEEGCYLVVDGWHRVLAARRAGLEALTADIRRGSRRDALLAAVAANASHGLRRSREDKRRSAAVLLQDEGWCQLSSRQLGELAGVSHAFINQVRKHYGVSPGQVLDEDRIAEVDGGLPERYQVLIQHTWSEPEVRKARTARTLAELANAVPGYGGDSSGSKAVTLRLEDLALADWPWAEDTTEAKRRRRAAGLDSLEDIAAAVLARDLPADPAARRSLFDIWILARRVKKLGSWELRDAAKLFKGRVALLEQVQAMSEKVDKDAANRISPYEAVRKLEDLAPREQLLAVEGAAVEVVERLVSRTEFREMSEELQAAAVARAATLEVRMTPCPDPGCDGFAVGSSDWIYCNTCRQRPADRQRQLDQALQDAPVLLAAGAVIEVVGTPISSEAAELLASLLFCSDGDRAWWEGLPDFVQLSLAPYVEQVEARKTSAAVE